MQRQHVNYMVLQNRFHILSEHQSIIGHDLKKALLGLLRLTSCLFIYYKVYYCLFLRNMIILQKTKNNKEFDISTIRNFLTTTIGMTHKLFEADLQGRDIYL